MSLPLLNSANKASVFAVLEPFLDLESSANNSSKLITGGGGGGGGALPPVDAEPKITFDASNFSDFLLEFHVTPVV